MRKASNFIDLTNQRFGKLIVISRALSPITDKRPCAYWNVVCDCGKTKIVKSANLRNGLTKSCGCLQRQNNDPNRIGRFRVAPGERGLNAIFSRYEKSANARGHSFELSKEEFKKLTISNCFYCGLEPNSIFVPHESTGNSEKTRMRATYVYNGIDRVNNDKGYSLDNCVPSCSVCNYSKRLLSIEQWNKWRENIALVYLSKK